MSRPMHVRMPPETEEARAAERQRVRLDARAKLIPRRGPESTRTVSGPSERLCVVVGGRGAFRKLADVLAPLIGDAVLEAGAPAETVDAIKAVALGRFPRVILLAPAGRPVRADRGGDPPPVAPVRVGVAVPARFAVRVAESRPGRFFAKGDHVGARGAGRAMTDDDERPWFIFAHPVGSGHVAVPCVSEEAGRRAMQQYAYKGATFPFEVPLLRTRVCSRAAQAPRQSVAALSGCTAAAADTKGVSK